MTDQDPRGSQLAELALLPEINPGPVCRLGRDGTILLANPAARAVFGDVLGTSWLAVCPGMTPAMWDAVLAGNGQITHQAAIGERWMSFTHAKPATGAAVFVFGTDITDYKEAEDRLAEQARFPEMNPGPVLRVRLDGIVVLANAAAQKVFGDELVGKQWLEICPAVDEARWAKALAATEPVSFEARLASRDYLFAHRRDVLGDLVFVFGTDVTDQRHAEQALRQSERMATLGTLAAGVAHELNNPAAATKRASDQLGEGFARLERAHLRIAGLDLNAVARDRLDELVVRAQSAAAEPGNLDALERSDREDAVEDWLDGYGVDAPWDLAPALVAQGFDPEALERLTDEFGEDVAPVVLDWAAAAFPIYVLAHEIGQGAGRISEIVGALKNYSYLGQAPLKAIDLREGIDNTLVILRSKLKKGVTVHRDYCSDLPLVPAYGSELNQVWTNLLDNAVDAMDGQGEIHIRTRRDGAWAHIEISDNGPGIPPAVLPRIFDAFYTTKEPGRGTGLGLSTTYSIVVDKHRGSITAASEPGRTTFTVRLPLHA